MVHLRHLIFLLALIILCGCSKNKTQPAIIKSYTVHISDTANEYPVYISGHIGNQRIAHSIQKPWDSSFSAQTGTDIYLLTSGNPDSFNNGWGNLLWLKLSCSYDYYQGLYAFTKPGDTTLNMDVKLP